MQRQCTARPARNTHAGDLSAWLTALAIAAIAAGVWFRFESVPVKDVYRDEVWTAMHVAGRSIGEVRALRSDTATSGSLVRAFEVPAGDTTAADTVRVLAVSDPQHPPLYYLAARAWEKLGGPPIERERLLSVLFGLALIAAMYWLALLLFRRRSAALLCAAFTAVSPYQAVFSAEVREWSLFMLLAVIATALLVRALDEPSAVRWAAYSFAMILTAYASVLALGVFAAHAIAAGAPGMRRQRSGFAAGASIAFAAYIPWLADMATRWQRANANAAYEALPTPAIAYGAKLLFGLTSFVFDAEYASLRFAAVALAALAAIAYALVVFTRSADARERWIVFALGAVPLLFFLISDAVLHGSRALQARYLLMTAVSVELALGCALAAPSRRRTAVAAFLLAAGLTSLVVAHGRAAWWDDADAAPMAQAAAVAERNPTAVVLFDDTFAALLFSNQASPHVRLAFSVRAALRRRTALYGFDLHRPMIRTVERLGHLRETPIPLAGAQTALRAGRASGTTFRRFAR